MSELWAKKVFYTLNCDHPRHDRVAFAKRRLSDADANEHHTHDCDTVEEARLHAWHDGWRVRPDGTCICKDCRDAERTKVSSQASGYDRVEPKQKLNPSNGDEQP